MMVSFLMLMFAELYVSGGNVQITFAQANEIKFDHKLITAVSVIVFAYNIQFLVFPAYKELENRSNERFSRASMISILIETVFYLAMSLMAYLMLGPGDISDDFLRNYALRPGIVSVAMRFLFCVLVVLDMPFMYIATKEQSLVMHDEIVNKSVSIHTEELMRR
mmetsp:Transcript_14851/g.18604  ORF Transcript_14851/g.18604 Transcript_14851/m.18604 type:complete len:164 (+) Transcript_14851:679-1170(+)